MKTQFAVHMFLGLIFFLLSCSSVGSKTKEDNTVMDYGVKWHPGHYLLLYSGTNDENIPNIVTELASHNGFRGIQRRYKWSDLEPSKDVYDFSSIVNDLNTLKKYDKQLVVNIHAKTFSNNEVIVPQYLLTKEYGGGVYPTKSGGTLPAYWNTNVQNRLIVLMNVMGEQLDKQANLEAISFDETAPSIKDADFWPTVVDDYIQGLINIAVATKEAFPHTVVLQYINYPVAPLPYMISEFKKAGVGIGGPDVFIKSQSLINGSYKYIKETSKILPIGMAVQNMDYVETGGSDNTEPSIKQLHEFAQNKLDANYIFWLRRTGNPNYYKRLTDYLDTFDWSQDSAGGLDTNLPEVFSEGN